MPRLPDNRKKENRASGDRREGAAEMVADLRFRRNVERVCKLGTRAVNELLSEIGAERAIQHLIDRKVARYAAINPHHLTVLGGDHFATPPLTLVKPTNNEQAT